MLSDHVPHVSQVKLTVPELGEITGLTYDNSTSQYLGIPYAEIPGRFRRSIPAPVWEDGVWDGTKLGPYCPQPPRDFYPIPTPNRPWLEAPEEDEFKCLNLNITVPRLPSPDGKPLPVMVFIHGGAFTYSTGSSPIYDGRILSSTSAEDLSRPTIVVTMNYRLGVYGFLAGHDIKEYNESHGEQGVGNYGIWDQVLALRWIHKHISAFGGDPERICLFGQSAGGVSINCHLLRDEPLFSSAILQSGLTRLCGVMSVDEYQVVYEKMLSELSIPKNLSSVERMNRLLQVDTACITAAMVPVFPVPVVTMALCDDQVLIPNTPLPKSINFETNFKIPKWCPEIMLGDCINECIIWNKAWNMLSVPDLLSKMDEFWGPEKTKLVAELYGITPELSAKETFDKIERFTSDGMYLIPNYYAEKANPSVYAWHFDVPSPYDNPWGGYAHHSFDNVLIWGVLKHTLPESHQKVGELMTEAWVKFANGEKPWERFEENGRWMVFSPQGAALKTEAEDIERGYKKWHSLHEAGIISDLSDLSDEINLKITELLRK